MRCGLLLGVVVACAPPAQPVGAVAPAPHPAESAAAGAPAPALAFAPWDGVYLLRSGESSHAFAWMRTLGSGVSFAIGPFVARSTAATPDGGRRLRVVDGDRTYGLALRPPGRDGLPWSVSIDGETIRYEQHVGPLEAPVRARLVEGARFVRLDQRNLGPAGPLEDALTRDVITVLPRGLVRMELPDSHGAASCAIDALMPTLDDDGKPLPSPLPPEGALGVVAYTMLKVDEGCSGRSLDADASGIDGGLRLFADRTGWIAGALVVGYMYSEVFVAPRVSRVDLERMRRAAQEEMEHQAE